MFFKLYEYNHFEIGLSFYFILPQVVFFENLHDFIIFSIPNKETMHAAETVAYSDLYIFPSTGVYLLQVFTDSLSNVDTMKFITFVDGATNKQDKTVQKSVLLGVD